MHKTASYYVALIFSVYCWAASAIAGQNDAAKPQAMDSSGEAITVHIRVDVAKTKGELKPIWRFFGADEPNYAYMKDGQTLISELGQLDPQHVYFRTHNLLCTGDSTPALKWGSTNAYREDADGKPIYDWTIVDRIFDTYLQRGVKPYAQIGFMPEALSTKPDSVPYQHQWDPAKNYNNIYTGWAYPPKDYDKWAELVYQWTKHCVDKYGADEVQKWYWEVWNEPNIGYWKGKPEQFYELHDRAVAAVRKALPKARVGGPDAAGGGTPWLRNFLEHCVRGKNYATGETGTPLDFISFHAKGSPAFVDGHVRMGISNQLRNIDGAFGIIASFPELKDKPIVIGESDPDGCAACKGPQLGYRNSTMYSSYTAASFARIQELADKHGVNIEGALTWAFEFEDQPLFAGFRQLATGSIDLPVLNTFRMFSKMSGQRLAVESDAAMPLDEIVKNGARDKPDISALASFDAKENKLCVLVWYYHDDDLPGPVANIDLSLTDLRTGSDEAQVQQYRIDADHSNAFTAWQRMGSPEKPTTDQLEKLKQAGQLATISSAEKLPIETPHTSLQILLPRQAVTLIVIQWPKS